MSVGWQVFRVICLLQMLGTVFLTFVNLVSLFNSGDSQYLFQALAFAVIAALPVFALNLLNTNYPDKPVVGKQKSIFNWLFLLNFLLLAFLFANFFSSLRSIQSLADLVNRSIFTLPMKLWTDTFFYTVLLLFHLIILYGLYIIRRLLYINHFTTQQFEFEDGKQ